jgi:glycosyltransferase involved in cell wall biosynthesis
MRVLCVAAYYTPAHVYGGPVRSISALCEGLVQAGADVSVFTTNANGIDQILDVPIAHPLEVNGVQVRYYPLTAPAARLLPFYFYSPQLRRACMEEINCYDVVYLPGNWTYPFQVAASAALQQEVPYVISPRGSFMDWSMQQKSLKKRIYLRLVEERLINQAAAIHATSSMEAEQQQKWSFASPLVVIPNGVDLSPYEKLPRRGRLLSRLNITPEETLSIFVGRLHKEKRPQLMVEAFSRVVEQNPASHLVIVGPDQDSSGKLLRETVHQKGLQSHIHFTGLLQGAELLQAYADADLLVLLSHRENFGMVVVEGMACGIPVLLSEEVGLAKDVSQAQAGSVVQPKAEAVSKEWLRLLSDSQLRREMGRRGKQLAYDSFAHGVVASQMIELFQSVVRGNMTGRSTG